MQEVCSKLGDGDGTSILSAYVTMEPNVHDTIDCLKQTEQSCNDKQINFSSNLISNQSVLSFLSVHNVMVYTSDSCVHHGHVRSIIDSGRCRIS